LHVIDETAFEPSFLNGARLISGTSGWRHAALGDVGSTNDLAFAAARVGDAGQLWITAERQLQGRGRRGRVWISEAGNLYASALLVFEKAEPLAFATLPLVAGLAVHGALSRAVPQLAHRLALKWPNDVLLGEAKLAGILLEGAALPGGRHAVVVGCGVNIRQAPQETPYPASTLAAAGCDLDAQTLFRFLAEAFQEKLEVWNRNEGAEDIVAEWRNIAAGMGQHIRVNLPDRSLEGRFSDIDADGYLLLDTSDMGRVRIAAGDVFLLT
jgi:BirA family transcriptional regulator, biotin operon repressor / biotin---[acetyl-CoA-carboxylase] ligase